MHTHTKNTQSHTHIDEKQKNYTLGFTCRDASPPDLISLYTQHEKPHSYIKNTHNYMYLQPHSKEQVNKQDVLVKLKIKNRKKDKNKEITMCERLIKVAMKQLK